MSRLCYNLALGGVGGSWDGEVRAGATSLNPDHKYLNKTRNILNSQTKTKENLSASILTLRVSKLEPAAPLIENTVRVK